MRSPCSRKAKIPVGTVIFSLILLQIMFLSGDQKMSGLSSTWITMGTEWEWSGLLPDGKPGQYICCRTHEVFPNFLHCVSASVRVRAQHFSPALHTTAPRHCPCYTVLKSIFDHESDELCSSHLKFVTNLFTHLYPERKQRLIPSERRGIKSF